MKFSGGGTETAAPWHGRLVSKVGSMLAAVVMLAAFQFVLANYMRDSVTTHLEQAEDIRHEVGDLSRRAEGLGDLLDDVSQPIEGADPTRLLKHWTAHLHRTLEADALVALEGMRSVRVRQIVTRMEVLLAAGAVTAADVQAVRGDLAAATESLRDDLAARLLALEQEGQRQSEHLIWLNRLISGLLFGVGGGGLILFGIVSGIFLIGLSRALERLHLKTREITAGEYGQPLPNGRGDELGQVTLAVNTMAEQLAERDRQLEDVQVRFSQQEKLFALGIFASGIAHEIRNPIQAIMAIADQVASSLVEDVGPSEAVQENVGRLAILSGQADRLSKIASQVSAFAAVEVPDPTPVDVHQVVIDTIDLMRFDPRFKRLKLTLDLGAKHSVVVVGKDHLVQALMNLLINAADAMPQRDGEIVISSRDEHGGVLIRVSDTGQGMADTTLAKAFEPFFTTKPKGTGTGLGLAICRTIIEETGGRINIDSEEGRGTTVSITLPHAEEACAY